MLVTTSDKIETLTSTGKGYIGKLLSNVSVGTFTTSGNTVTITGGVDLRKYALNETYVYSSTNNQLKKVIWSPRATQEASNILNIESAFTNPVAGDNFVLVIGKYKSMYVRNTGAGAGTVASGSIKTGDELPISEVYRIDPLVFDATGTTLVFTLTY